MIIYVHGFASAGGQFKYKLLKRDFPDFKILSPTLPVEPDAVVAELQKLIDAENDMTMLVGTSLGGFYAYYLAVTYQIQDKVVPAAIINPSLEPYRTLKPALGIFHNIVTGEPFEWKSEYLEQLRRMASEIDKQKIDPQYMRFYVSSDDELLDHTGIEEKIPEGSEIKYFDHSAHRFTRFSEIFPEIRQFYIQSRRDYIQMINPL